MKTATVPSRGPLSLGLSLLTALVCVLSLLIPVSATAESVDSELLLLVDVANGGLDKKKGEFKNLMEGYAAAFTSAEVLNSIASGKSGKIAVSLAFFGSKPDQSAGIPWMAIGSLAEAEAFADQLLAMPEPDGGNFNYEDALLQGLLSFGTEAGGTVDNGFTSAVQIVEVAGASKPKGDVSGATALALAEGVSIINATVVGKKAGKKSENLETYYADNVIGGELGGNVASVSTSPIDGGLAGVLQTQLGTSVGNGAISSVPEPSSSVILISSIGALLLYRRRRSA